MKVDKRILNYSFWLSLSTILIFPGSFFTLNTKAIEYGFPFPFLIHYHQDNWFIRGVGINLLNYLFDVVVIYFLLIGIKKLYEGFIKRNKH